MVLNLVNTNTKDFRIVATKNGDEATLRKFITKFISPSNNIVADWRRGCNFLVNNGYLYYLQTI